MDENICYALWQLSLRDCGWRRRWYFVRLEGHTICCGLPTILHWKLLSHFVTPCHRFAYLEFSNSNLFQHWMKWLPLLTLFPCDCLSLHPHTECVSRGSQHHTFYDQSIFWAVIDASEGNFFHFPASCSRSLSFSVRCTALHGSRVFQLPQAALWRLCLHYEPQAYIK